MNLSNMEADQPSLADYGIVRRERAILDRKGVSLIYIIGNTDTGKTTLANLIASHLSVRHKTALVDLDAGQAAIGLPATFGWAMMTARGRVGKVRGMYFTGITSPVGYFEESVAGATALVAEARRRAQKIVVDTCGVAEGAYGRELHYPTVEKIRPDVVIAIENAHELDSVIESFEEGGWPIVIRVDAPERVKRRSPTRRRSYRAERFRKYFENAGELKLSLDSVGIVNERADAVDRIASLRNSKGRDIALAIIVEFNRGKGKAVVFTPLADTSKVQFIVMGSMKVARDGTQLAWNV